MKSEIAWRIAPQLAALKNLQELWLDELGPEFADAELRHFVEHPNLKRLTLGKTGLSDGGLALLATLPQLEELSLGSERITAAGIPALAASPRLRAVRLAGVRGDADPGMALRELPWLEEVSLHDCRCPSVSFEQATPNSADQFARLKIVRVSGPGVESIQVARLPGLRELSLELPQARVFEIRELLQLDRLDVSFASGQVVDRFTMSGLPELTWLSLQCGSTGAHMPEDAFEHLLSLKKLKGGIVWGLELPAAAKEQLVRFREATGHKLN